MPRRVVFVSHRNQLEHFASCCQYICAAGWEAELWTVDEADFAAGQKTGLFSRVVNLLSGYRRGSAEDVTSALRPIQDLEVTFGPFFHGDAAVDRSIVGFSDASMDFGAARDRWSEPDLTELAATILSG